MAWWEKKYGKDSRCGITMGRLRPGKNKDGLKYTIFLDCGHGFYRSALGKWAVKNPSCPLCRKCFDPIVLVK